jgi:hypothetical protein
MMLLGGSGLTNSEFSSVRKSKPYSGPKRTFSIVRNRDKNNSIVLIDNKPDSETRPHNNYFDIPLRNYVVDSVTYGSPHPAAPTPASLVDDRSLTGVTLVNNTPEISVASEGISITEGPSELDGTAWDELEIDTDDFLPAVVPQWIDNKEIPQKLPVIVAAKARIKRMGKGWFMRLVRQAKPGHEEVAYIHMGETLEETKTATATALNSIDIEPRAPENIQERAAVPILNPIEGPPFYVELFDTSLPHELDATSAPSASSAPALANRSGYIVPSGHTTNSQPDYETLPGPSKLLQISTNQIAL